MTMIGDLASEAIIKLENRTTDLTRAYNWTRDALIEICSNQELRGEFDVLDISGPPVNLSINVREYPFSTIYPPGIDNDGTLDIRLWRDPPKNSIFFRLDNFSYQFADNYSNNPGMPTQWYRFGDTIGFDMIPNAAYQVQGRFTQAHPLVSPIQNTVILLPVEWNEILVLAAVEKGFVELNEYEKSNAVHSLLWGDPDPHNKNASPGLINSRKKRRDREAWRKEVPLRPWVARYSR